MKRKMIVAAVLMFCALLPAVSSLADDALDYRKATARIQIVSWNPAQAYTEFRAIAEQSPETKVGKLADMDSAWAKHYAGDNQMALSMLDACLTKYVADKELMARAYWYKAKIAVSQANDELAFQSYYGAWDNGGKYAEMAINDLSGIVWDKKYSVNYPPEVVARDFHFPVGDEKRMARALLLEATSHIIHNSIDRAVFLYDKIKTQTTRTRAAFQSGEK